ncbi:MBL fold metallo-hydrolase [Thermodesulfobacteriota bacterium]
MASNEEGQLISEAAELSLREISRKKMHHGNEHFLNPFSSRDYNKPFRILSWKLFSKNHFKKYYNQEKVKEVRLEWDRVIDHKGSAITFLKHSCVMIKDVDKYLLVDPILFGLMWFQDFSPVVSGLDEMPRPDHVLLTHGHYDHMDTASIKRLGSKTHFITPLGYDEIFKDLKIEQRAKLDWFDSYSDGKMDTILIPCNHWTMRNPITGPNRSLWGSFLIKGAGGYNTFISGDAAYFDRYKEIGEEYAIDLAIFNLGAYEPRWFMAGSHMNPEETAKAFLDLKAKRLMIVHWGAFRLGDEPVHFPPLDMKKEMERRGIPEKLVIINPGQTYYPENDEVL